MSPRETRGAGSAPRHHGETQLDFFFAAQGLQGLQGLHGFFFFAAQGLQGLHFFAAQGLQGLHGLHGLLAAAQGLKLFCSATV